MTSEVIVTFNSPKDFTVSIDNIDSISPRGLELAEAKIVKTFLEIKGHNRHEAEAKAAAEVEEAIKVAQDQATVAQMAETKLSKFKDQALEEAAERFAEMKLSDVESFNRNVKTKATNLAKLTFLENVQNAVVDMASGMDDYEDMSAYEIVDKVIESAAVEVPADIDQTIEESEAALEILKGESDDS